MEPQPVVGREILVLGLGVRLIGFLQALQHVLDFGRKGIDHLDEVATSVAQTIRRDHAEIIGHIA
jgi:hypothetical protein